MERLTKKQKHILQQKLCDIKNRCNNPKNKFYKIYGERGIKVCEEWMDKKNGHYNFQRWAIESGWKETLSIDRIDINGNYEPSNCRWATPREQAINRRTTILTTINGVTKTTQEWAEQIGITERAFLNRIEYGWNEERLLEPKYKPLKMTKAEMSKEIREWRKFEEQGLLIRLPDSDWKHLIEQINVIVTNDFIVYKERAEFVISDIYMIGGDEEFRFKAECRCFHAAGEYWECDRYEECNIGNDDCSAEECGCIICFDFSEIGKTIFLTKEEAEAALAEMEG